MLRTDEYLEIENKWKKYKRKQLFKFILIIVFLVSIIVLLIAISNILFFKNNNTTIMHNLTDNIEVTIKNASIFNNSSNLSNATVDINNTKTSEDDKNLTAQNITTTTSNQNTQVETSKETSTPQVTKTKSSTTSSANTKKEINSDIKPPKSQNAIDNNSSSLSNNILIETKEISNIDSLINRFNATRNIVLAIMISEEFYDEKDYANSLKWALIANDIDSKNEKSWIMFAKSKAQQGKSDEAMHALQVFIKHFPNSNSAKSLLESLKNDNFK